MKPIRVGFGGVGCDIFIDHYLSFLERANRGGFEFRRIPSRDSFYRDGHQLDIYHELFGHDAFKRFALNRVRGVKNVCHWIGTDVEKVSESQRHRLRNRLSNAFVDLQLCNAPHLQARLARLGIETTLVRTVSPSLVVDEIPALPERFTVLVYAPAANPTLYHRDDCLRLAAERPEWQWIFAGSETPNEIETPPNATFVGWVADMPELLRGTSALLRWIDHDGESLMITETLVRGRRVVYNAYDRELCVHATTAGEILAALDVISSQTSADYETASKARAAHDPDRIVGELMGLYRELAGRPAHPTGAQSS